MSSLVMRARSLARSLARARSLSSSLSLSLYRSLYRPNSVQVLSLFLFHLLCDSSHTLGILILGQRSKSSACTQNLSPLV